MTRFLTEVKSTIIELIGNGIATLPGLLLAIFILILTRFLAGFVNNIVRKVASTTLRNRSLQVLMTQSSFVLTWIVGILMACVIAFPGLALGDIIALLGLSSVAFGFAFQDIFKNFLAGILLLLQEPFALGDQIIVADFEGTVETIALRSTQIRTYRGEMVVIPNSVVFTSPVQVLTERPQRRTDLEIGVDYNTPLPEAVQTLFEAVVQVEGVLDQPKPEVDVVSFGDSSINLVVRYWTAPKIADVRRTRSRVMIALKQACDRAEISIPYPIRSLYFFDQEQFNDHQQQPLQDQPATRNGRDS
ncbi:mechanosensitive ion channel family protein [Lyngbya confervoides]|uniref:Mechanosensitive ion channel family protein n=1 Tax=Lyngbya confervoides BDU141951 TaxID=1574623 RepID=A0ABD4SZS8_9CYAN|nr:mechanosensitive ion channel family protein [Lyngbya confervoides]MCM1981894.1 mechanosensitive ion channel family protein [Lyngbya confervoides BDU141951]